MGRDGSGGGGGGREALMARCASRADDELRWFRSSLRWIGMDHSTACHAVISWFFFLLLSVAVPAASHFVLTYHPHRRPYDAVVQLSLSAASALSFLSLAAGTRRIGLRRFLFLHRLHYKTDRVRTHYSAQLARSFRLLAALALPCFALEAAYKAWWYAVGASEGRIPFVGSAALGDALACLLELASWAYRAAVFLLACVLFRLTKPRADKIPKTHFQNQLKSKQKGNQRAPHTKKRKNKTKTKTKNTNQTGKDQEGQKFQILNFKI